MSVCLFCRREMRSLEDVLILNENIPSKFPDAFFCHEGCGNDEETIWWYPILLRRITDEGDPSHPYGDRMVGWLRHLKEKNWFTGSMERAVRASHLNALQLSKKPKRAYHT